MKLNKFTVVLAVLLISIMAIGAVSAESVDDSGFVAVEDGDIQGSVEVTDVAEDLSTADTADETVGDDSGGPDDTVNYDLDDDTYSTYFNEDGTATEALSADGNYYLNVGTLTNKDIKIVSGQNVYIQGKEGAGIINDGTITIGDGTEDKIGTVQISGLTFINNNKDAIVVNQYANGVAIAQNKFDLTYDDTYAGSPMAIVTYGYVDGTIIVNNEINMESAGYYTYGIDLCYYLANWAGSGDANGEHFYVANNKINIHSTAFGGMAEAMYLDTIINSVIEGNNITVVTDNAGVANYGMQVSDSWGFFNVPWAASPYNVTIKDNTIVLDSADLAYGISVISLWPYDENYGKIVKDMIISGNEVNITTQTEGVGICADSSDVSIVDNKVTLKADHNPIAAYVDSYIGNESCAIFVNNFNNNMGYYVNNTVTGNTIETTENPIRVSKNEDGNDPLVIEDNTFETSYVVLNDGNYDIYFYANGTVKDYLSPSGDYTLVIDTLTDKDIVIHSGSNILITGKEGAGFINDGTIYLDGGADGLVGSITISGLTFTNTNKGAVDIAEYCTFITIQGNTMDLVGDSSANVYTLTAISPHNFIYGLAIIDNNITVTGDVPYSNGIYAMNWGAADTPSNFNISGNTIVLDISSTSGSNAAIYVEVSDSVIENNNITVKSVGNAFAYGIQVPDTSYTMMAYSYDPTSNSPTNVEIKNNIVNLETQYMAYGITVISFGYDVNEEELFALPLNIVISDNNVVITSEKGVIGVGGIFYDGSISNNDINVIGGSSEEVTSQDMIGVGTTAIYVNSRAASIEDEDYEVNVKNNNIFTNVVAEDTNDEDYVIFDNTIVSAVDESGAFIVNESTYDIFFDEKGNLKTIPQESTLLLGDLSNKKMIINAPITIKALSEDSTLINTTINLVAGADNSVIDGLNMEFTGDNTTGSIGIIYIKDVTNVTISNNKITVPDFVDKVGAKYGSSVYAIEVESGMSGCKDISINNNAINMAGTCRYLYGIDVFKTYKSENRNNNINIFENNITINGGSKMAEAIYVSESDDVIIDGNIISSTSNGAAYGVATDQLTNAVITSNNIAADAATQAYGITATTSGSGTIIRANEIDAKGTGAVGIGINHQDGITIEDNTVAIDGGDYTTITSSDTLGTANAAVLSGDGNTNVEMNNNDVSEVSAVRLDTVIEVSDLTVTAAPSGNGSLQITLKTAGGMALANQVVKVVFNSQMYELTTDAKGVAVLSFPLNKSGTYNTEVFYLGDDNYRGADASAKITINKVKTALTASGKTFLATATTKKLTATLKDANGNPLAKKTVSFTVNGKTYKATTNAKGVATVKLALKAAKTYTVKIKFAADSVYAASTKSVKVKLNKEKTKITAPKKTFKKSAKTKKVVITLKNSKGKAIASKKITLTVNKKKYTVKTNKKGKATFKVKLTKKGTFKYTVKFAGDTQYKAVTKKTGKIVIK
ncbi:Ig-like domain repeat protein [Methanobrevibacter sp.]|uniref:Ig-like domain-containing protein n=1 Tax=Methanobrevibacter sp. TaxID=66852 RepID=UPI0025EA68B0|nr:Ig-like domain repeat protein [Methanobrevibacter sp.]MBQ2962481.1 Ig-like domain repeat protein [Methanobrevibacter sp.]